MSIHADGERLDAAREAALRQILLARNPRGAWKGELSSSPLATAAAVCAVALAEQHVDDHPGRGAPGHDSWLSGVLFRGELTQLIIQSLRWLADRQNLDGGWGDAERSCSTLPATMMVRAAFQLTGVPAKYAGLVDRADDFIARHGGRDALRQGSRESETLRAGVLASFAIAGLMPWARAVVLPFDMRWALAWRERLVSPPSEFDAAVRGAFAAARHTQARAWMLPLKLLRGIAVRRQVARLAKHQSPNGGFGASIVTTGFVVMGLAGADWADRRVVRQGVEFLLSTVRPDGSWSIETDHAVIDTAQAISALRDQALRFGETAGIGDVCGAVDWLVAKQRRASGPRQSFLNGGWPASESDGAPPSVRATSQALEALASCSRGLSRGKREEVHAAVTAGVKALLEAELETGGWGRDQPGDRPAEIGSVDVTSDVVSAVHACLNSTLAASGDVELLRKVRAAISRGIAFVIDQQRSNGAWAASCFGNQHQTDSANQTYGTAGVLRMASKLGMTDDAAPQRGARWLASVQHASGGWGPAPSEKLNSIHNEFVTPLRDAAVCTVEETGAAIEALLPFRFVDPKIEQAVDLGVAWLCEAMLSEAPVEPGPISLTSDQLWYSDRLQGFLHALVALSAVCGESVIAARAAAGTESSF